MYEIKLFCTDFVKYFSKIDQSRLDNKLIHFFRRIKIYLVLFWRTGGSFKLLLFKRRVKYHF